MKWFKLIVAIMLSGSLLLGAVQTEAASNTQHVKQVKQPAKKYKSSSKIHLKDKYVLEKGYSKKRLITLMRPEALKIVKALDQTYTSGSTKRYNSYLVQHVTGVEKSSLEEAKQLYKESYLEDKKRFGKRVMKELKNDLQRAKIKDLKWNSTYKPKGLKDYLLISYKYTVKKRSFGVVFVFDKVKRKSGIRLVDANIFPFVYKS
ncbi:hypothetical protein A374_07151 [Fictibacillus macauensis ZFHKF-1]|uniref:Lipoprotein n=1 Tax=Fictibacillus macauensis ZFHKF-1 TaxID=1196324 RepID=I8UGZ5_9BACL|nr:hypothetical protein [Fictibacillus macauensis]EIT86078.1 hypothetical protein A374_07151 [Fictibacillus macauensis ZFHKF-1]